MREARDAVCRSGESPRRPEAVGGRIRLVGAAVTVGALTLAEIAGLAQAPAPRSLWDGIYTDAQASRASAEFSQTCARCHSLTAEGSRPLSGDRFWDRNSQKTVGELLAFVSANMPSGNGGSLSASTYNDLLALILRSNGVPAGPVELTPERVASVVIVPKDGPRELPANTLVRVVGCLARDGRDWVLTSATPFERSEKSGAVPEDATRPLGDRTVALKFVLTRLDNFVGHRMAVTGILIGAGGVDGVNVTTVNRVSDACP